MRRVYLADEDPEFRDTLAERLRDAELSVEIYVNTAELRRAMTSGQPELVMVGLPPEGEDHAAILSEIVRGLPCIVLAGDDKEAERIIALELGADDVVNKAAPHREIVARVQAVLRRARRGDAGQGTGDGWQFVPQLRRLVRPDGSEVVLTAAEFALLDVLVRNQGFPIDRETLFAAVFDRPFRPFDRAIDTLVAKLRNKLGDAPRNSRMILTVRPRGYVFQGFSAQERRSNQGT